MILWQIISDMVTSECFHVQYNSLFVTHVTFPGYYRSILSYFPHGGKVNAIRKLSIILAII